MLQVPEADRVLQLPDPRNTVSRNTEGGGKGGVTGGVAESVLG